MKFLVISWENFLSICFSQSFHLQQADPSTMNRPVLPGIGFPHFSESSCSGPSMRPLILIKISLCFLSFPVAFVTELYVVIHFQIFEFCPFFVRDLTFLDLYSWRLLAHRIFYMTYDLLRRRFSEGFNTLAEVCIVFTSAA